jgi:multidrug resistance efflux pump
LSRGPKNCSPTAAAKAPGTISELELVTAKVQADNAQRKYDLLLEIAKAALETAAAELKRATQLHQAGAASLEEVSAAESRAKILRLLLSRAN